MSNAFEWPQHARRVEPSAITINGQPLPGTAAALPDAVAVQALAFDQIGEATRRFYREAEQRARDLPDPPSGYRWALVVEHAQLTDREPLGAISMEGRFELVATGVDADPAESDWETIDDHGRFDVV